MDHQEDTAPMDGSFIVVPKDTPSSSVTTTTASQEQQAHTTVSAATTVTTTTATTTTTTKTIDGKVHTSKTEFTESTATKSLLQKELQALSTPNKVFQNWAKTFRCVPEQYYTPTTEEEIVKVGSGRENRLMRWCDTHPLHSKRSKRTYIFPLLMIRA